jgi:hypothetical protein
VRDREFDFDPLRRFVGVLLQQGRVQLDADSDDWSDRRVHDPGITLLELLAYVTDQLSAYADQVAAEARMQTRRRIAIAAGVSILVLTGWCRRPRP